MGGKGGSTKYVERPLTPEEKRLISLQGNYVESLQPAVRDLVARGTQAISGTITPDYQSIYDKASRGLSSNQQSINELASGKLPDNYADSKKDYYNQVMNNSFGSMMAEKASKGILGGSTVAKSLDGLQKNMTAQMSKDYSNDMATQSGLLQQQQSSVMQPLQLGQAINSASFGNAAQYLGLATGQGTMGNQTLSSIGDLKNNSGAFVQKQGKGLF